MPSLQHSRIAGPADSQLETLVTQGLTSSACPLWTDFLNAQHCQSMQDLRCFKHCSCQGLV